jgi:hypothetical protein
MCLSLSKWKINGGIVNGENPNSFGWMKKNISMNEFG